MTEPIPAIRDAMRQRAGAKRDARLDWWREARFGLFIHWGLYAIPAGTWKGEQIPGIGEWIMHRARIPIREYEPLARQFNPVRYDPREWVALAKAAGQKYIVITSKHHDGFCLFDSALTDYSVAKGTPYGHDVIKILADECARQEMRLGFYYSQTQDWHHPGGDANDWDYDPAAKDFDGYVEDYVKPQVRELLTNYGSVALIWFDTPKGISATQSRELVDLVHAVQPDCLVSGRIGNALGDYAQAGDNRIPEVAVEADWETPATINDTWGFKSYDHNWKSVDDLVRKLVDIVSKNGNYLLNVGPTAEGIIPEPSVERLRAMGQWLAVNGEAVYGTAPGPIQGVPWCRSTAQGGKVYLHVFDWPADGRVIVPRLARNVASAHLLTDPSRAPLKLTQGAEGPMVSGPAQAPEAIDTVIVLE